MSSHQSRTDYNELFVIHGIVLKLLGDAVVCFTYDILKLNEKYMWIICFVRDEIPWLCNLRGNSAK